MNRLLVCALFASALGSSLSMQALADDTNSTRPVVSHKKMMKDCMAKEKQATPTASEEDMKKTCREKIESYNQHPSETKSPPNNP
jgi:hypothetical protein